MDWQAAADHERPETGWILGQMTVWGWRTSVSILSCQLWSFFFSRDLEIKGVFLFSPPPFLWCVGTKLCPAAQKLIIEGVRGGRCLPSHFTVPTCFMNEQPPGSRDWPTSSARTSQPLALFQSKCVHSAHFSADRGLMQLGGVPGNAKWAGVIIPRGLLTLMFGSRAGIFCFLLPFTVKKGKKGVKLQRVEDRFPLFTEALGFLRILPKTSGLLEVCCVIVDGLWTQLKGS